MTSSEALGLNISRTLESAEPPIRALGVTDYYLLDGYRAVRDAREQGQLQGCELIFANVEMRLAVGTVKGSWVNLHLLVSPEDPQHLDEIGRFLARLTFSAHGDSFNCRPDDLMRLGRKADPAIDDQTAALRRGAEQFKVSFDQLREKYRESQWAKENVLIAVAGAKDNGTSGLREGSDQTLRQEVERFAHIIFASSPAQRDYWLGRKTSPKDIVDRYDSLKPCLHGSDGHSLDRTGKPDGARYSWIKGSPIFDALRQACIDPEGRAYVGEEPPLGAAPSELISSILMAGTPWAKREHRVKSRACRIIGARGSGKTALADIIAAGCDAHGATMPKKAFLARAREHLPGRASAWPGRPEKSEVRKLEVPTRFVTTAIPALATSHNSLSMSFARPTG